MRLTFALISITLACLGFGIAARSDNKVRLPVPLVFTCRDSTASLQTVVPASPAAWPGTQVPRASKGSLMILYPDGQLRDLTADAQLPGGRQIIDVMSPSVSLDGKKIIFSGITDRREHFRLFEIHTDGSSLKQLTGTPDDKGCLEDPYLINDSQGRKLTGDERRRIDFDDLDGAYLPDSRIVFSSTRWPRRSLHKDFRVTNLFVMDPGRCEVRQITFNLAAERWPYVLKDGRILYSYWSVVPVRATDRGIISRSAALKPGAVATGPSPDIWWPAVVNPDGTELRALTKPATSCIRARPLFNDNLIYTTAHEANIFASYQRTWLEQIPPGVVGTAFGGILDSSVIPGRPVLSMRGPAADATAGSAAHCPAPVPGGMVAFSYKPKDGQWGLYLTRDAWPAESPWRESDAEKLLEIPGKVLADAQAVYPRKCLVHPETGRMERQAIKLKNSKVYYGPIGALSSTSIYMDPVPKAPGQYTAGGEGPLFSSPPKGLIRSIECYAIDLQKDDQGVYTGRFSTRLIAAPKVSDRGAFAMLLPPGRPVLLLGRDQKGRLAVWDSAVAGVKQAAFTGDHYSYTKEGVLRNSCVGCHAGHTVLPGSGLSDVIVP